MNKKADLQKVINQINENVRTPSYRKEFIDKVTNYNRTKNPHDDLTNGDASKIYHNINVDQKTKLNDGKELEIHHSDHGKYREQLRDIPPERINNAIRHELSIKRKKQDFTGEERIKGPGNSTMVVDYDTRKTTVPAEARLITVFSSLKSRRNKK